MSKSIEKDYNIQKDTIKHIRLEKDYNIQKDNQTHTVQEVEIRYYFVIYTFFYGQIKLYFLLHPTVIVLS